MHTAVVIAGKDLRQRLRDRTAYLVGIVAPLVLAALIGFAFGRSDQPFRATYAVADLDRGPVATAFLDDVLGSPGLAGSVTVRRVADPAEAARLAEDGAVAAAIVIPAGYSTAVSRGGVPALQVVRNAGSPLGADVAVSLAQSFAARLAATSLSVRTAAAAGPPAGAPALQALARRAAQFPAPVVLTESAIRTADPAAAIAPAMGIFFLYFVIGLQARSLVLERQRGTLVRLLAAPVRARTLLVGKALAAFVLGMAALGTMAVASAVLLGARWGDPLSAVALIGSMVFAATSVIAFVLTLARTEQQASLYTSLVTFGFALLGGNFVSLAQAPEVLRRLALLTPNGWALRALGDLSAGVDRRTALLPAIAAICAFGVATALLAAARADRLVRL